MRQGQLFSQTTSKPLTKAKTSPIPEIARHLTMSMFGEAAPEDRLCDVFICTLENGRVGTLFRMRVGDAKKLCSHPETKVRNYTGEWMLLWTTEGLIADDSQEWIKDDGRFNDLMIELDIHAKSSSNIYETQDSPSITTRNE